MAPGVSVPIVAMAAAAAAAAAAMAVVWLKEALADGSAEPSLDMPPPPKKEARAVDDLAVARSSMEKASMPDPLGAPPITPPPPAPAEPVATVETTMVRSLKRNPVCSFLRCSTWRGFTKDIWSTTPNGGEREGEREG